LAYGCLDSKKRVFAVDTFNGNRVDFPARNFFDEFSRNLEERGLARYVKVLAGLSVELAKSWDGPIHLLFIDGSHQYDEVLADFHGFFPHVVPDGIIALHDVTDTWPGPQKVWDEVVRPRLHHVGYCSTLAFGRKAG
jgi:hypothetical protein